MYYLNEALREKIYSKINNNFEFCDITEKSYEEDCSCKGGCGTYTPPCSCCAYN